MIVVYGGTSSGKSNIAETIAVNISKRDDIPLFYLATMESSSDAAKERISHHKKMREGKGFVTIEEMYNPYLHLDMVDGGVVLLECMSNLVANVYFRASSGNVFEDDIIEELADKICASVLELSYRTKLVVVTNNVFHNGYYEDAWCDSYMKLLGIVNKKLAAMCQSFIEVEAGIAKVIKGDNIWLY